MQGLAQDLQRAGESLPPIVEANTGPPTTTSADFAAALRADEERKVANHAKAMGAVFEPMLRQTVPTAIAHAEAIHAALEPILVRLVPGDKTQQTAEAVRDVLAPFLARLLSADAAHQDADAVRAALVQIFERLVSADEVGATVRGVVEPMLTQLPPTVAKAVRDVIEPPPTEDETKSARILRVIKDLKLVRERGYGKFKRFHSAVQSEFTKRGWGEVSERDIRAALARPKRRKAAR